MKRKGKVFIDANIIIHAGSFQKADVFHWINQLYEEIYIHIEVLKGASGTFDTEKSRRTCSQQSMDFV